jgi:hypothetical protein
MKLDAAGGLLIVACVSKASGSSGSILVFFGDPDDSFLGELVGDLLVGERGGTGKASASSLLLLPAIGDFFGVRGDFV